MRIALVIDSLNSGGAQRQMAILAVLLKESGHEVGLFRYRALDFFKPALDAAQIPIFEVSSGKVARIPDMRRQVRDYRPDVAIAFLPTPNLLLELAGLPRRKFGIIVSERIGRIGKLTARDRFSFNLHRLADAVVNNSYDSARYISAAVPALKKKTHVITNCVDLDLFSPGGQRIWSETPSAFAVLARFNAQKNAMGFAEAVRIVVDKLPADAKFVVDWYGNNFYRDGKPTDLSQCYDDVATRIRELGIEQALRLHPPATDVLSIYRKADAFVLPSFVEGTANVICEALACGLPVLTSNVCDNPLWVTPGENGLLFDPYKPDEIAKAILDFMKIESKERKAMGQRSRELAEAKLSKEVFVGKYLTLIEEVAGKYQTGA